MDHFWRALAEHLGRPAILDGEDGVVVSYRALLEHVAALRPIYQRRTKALVFIEARLELRQICHLLAAWQAGHAVHLYAPTLDEIRLCDLRARFLPEIEIGRRGLMDEGPERPDLPIDDSLGLMLSTSGSLGSAKMIRLSFENLFSNASQISDALSLDASRRSPTCLPYHFIYGLSTITSALLSGGSIALIRSSLLDSRFWRLFSDTDCNTLHGVSRSYELLMRLSAQGLNWPTLSAVTHSGDRLSEAAADWMVGALSERGVDVFKMYGATEAAGRISVLPPTEFPRHPDSAGLVVPRGEISVSAAGELIYRGPNVMLGYASSRRDLCRGDDAHGVLATGDLGEVTDGRVYIKGRLGRTTKIEGLRFDLDDLSERLTGGAVLAAASGQLGVFYTGEPADRIARWRQQLRELKIFDGATHFVRLDELPRTEGGKLAYGELTDILLDMGR